MIYVKKKGLVQKLNRLGGFVQPKQKKGRIKENKGGAFGKRMGLGV